MRCLSISLLVSALACAVLSRAVVAQDVEPSERSAIARRLDEIRTIEDSPRRLSLLSMELSNWSGRDLVGMYSYIASVDDWDLSRPGIQGPEGLRVNRTVIIRNTDFHELAALNGELPPPFDVGFRGDVVQGLARQDPVAAIEFFETLPESERREAGIDLVNTYAHADPEAAFEWVLASGEMRLMDNVMHAAGEENPLLALDLAVRTGEAEYLVDVAQAVILSGSMAPADFGDVLLNLPESEAREQALVTMVDRWAVPEPVQALEWLIANSDVTSASPQAYRRVGGRLVDADIAEQYIDRVPASARAIWIQTIANHIGTSDPARAADWIATYRDEPAYAPAMGDIAFYMVSRDGPRAAGLLREAALDDDPAQVQRVARIWASRDPQGTIEWVQALPDDAARTAGLAGVGRVWSRQDPAAAQAWVLGLPEGEQRNAVLYAMIEIAVILGDFSVESSTVFFDAYSDDSARQIASANIARELADRNQEASANDLLDRYVSDAELRRQYVNGEPLLSGL